MKTKIIHLAKTCLFCFLTLLNCQRKDFELAGTQWNIRSLRSNEASNAQEAQATYTLAFSANHTYSLQLDANQCGGDYSIASKGKIRFTEMSCTEMCCDSDFAVAVARRLPQLSAYEVSGNVLTLRGNGELTLTRRP